MFRVLCPYEVSCSPLRLVKEMVSGVAHKEEAMGKIGKALASVFDSPICATVVGALILSASPISVKWSAEKGFSFSQDKVLAVIGRPATPGSVAGVHRRVERRAVRRCAAGVTCPHY